MNKDIFKRYNYIRYWHHKAQVSSLYWGRSEQSLITGNGQLCLMLQVMWLLIQSRGCWIKGHNTREPQELLWVLKLLRLIISLFSSILFILLSCSYLMNLFNWDKRLNWSHSLEVLEFDIGSIHKYNVHNITWALSH